MGWLEDDLKSVNKTNSWLEEDLKKIEEDNVKAWTGGKNINDILNKKKETKKTYLVPVRPSQVPESVSKPTYDTMGGLPNAANKPVVPTSKATVTPTPKIKVTPTPTTTPTPTPTPSAAIKAMMDVQSKIKPTKPVQVPYNPLKTTTFGTGIPNIYDAAKEYDAAKAFKKAHPYGVPGKDDAIRPLNDDIFNIVPDRTTSKIAEKLKTIIGSFAGAISRPFARGATRVLHNDWTDNFENTPDEWKPFDILTKEETENAKNDFTAVIDKTLSDQGVKKDNPVYQAAFNELYNKNYEGFIKGTRQDKLQRKESDMLRDLIKAGPGWKAEEDVLVDMPVVGKMTTKDAGETAATMGEMIGFTMLTGNPFAGGFLQGALDASGRGGSDEEILKAGIQSGTFNAVGGKAGKLAGKGLDKLIQNSPLKNTILGELATKFGSGAAFGTAGTATEFITNPDHKPTANDFFHNALMGAMFEVVPATLSSVKIADFNKSKVFEGMKTYEQEMKSDYYKVKTSKDFQEKADIIERMVERNNQVKKGLESNKFTGASKEAKQAGQALDLINKTLTEEMNSIKGFNEKVKTPTGINHGTYAIPEGKFNIQEVKQPEINNEVHYNESLPMKNRTYDNVGDRNVNAYQYEHPEVKDNIQTYADYILRNEFSKGNAQLEAKSDTMKRLKQHTKTSYDEIEKALQNIIKNEGSENYAIAKKVERVLDENLTNGFTAIDGTQWPPDKDYLSKKIKIEGEIKPPDELPVLQDVNRAKPIEQPEEQPQTPETKTPIKTLDEAYIEKVKGKFIKSGYGVEEVQPEVKTVEPRFKPGDKVLLKGLGEVVIDKIGKEFVSYIRNGKKSAFNTRLFMRDATLVSPENISAESAKEVVEKNNSVETTDSVSKSEPRFNENVIDSGNGDIIEETPRDTNGKSPDTHIADKVVNALKTGEKINNAKLFTYANEAYKGGQAEGKYSPKDAYDAMELGVNKYLERQTEIDLKAKDASTVKKNVKELVKLMDNLPTQGRNRTDEMIEFQQFSTPPSIAYIASYVANIKSNDVLLEPSAGIGGLAVFGKINGAKTIVNELSGRRLEVLKKMDFDQYFNENAEQLNNILPKDIKPTVIIMNPPFSSTAGRKTGKNDTKNAIPHIEQALKRLEPNGRLIGIVGKGMAIDTPMFRDWWKKLQQTYNVRANVGINGKNYEKYGTTFDIQLFVIDKTGSTTSDVITGNYESLTDVIDKLEAIANERPEITTRADTGNKQEAVKHNSTEISKEDKGESGSNNDLSSSTDRLGIKESGSDSGGAAIDKNGSPKPSGKAGDIKESKQGDGNIVEDKHGDIHGEGTSKIENTGGSSGTPDRGNQVGADRGRSDVKVEQKSATERKTKTKELTDSVYSDYIPQKLKIKGAKPHPGPLAQSAAMAAVEPPDPTYTPNLPKEVIEEGKLSIAQLEAIVYAGQAHQQILPDGSRKGFFIGDGTGVGKGREISGIILDNLRQGRKKAVWISKNDALFVDAQRDFGGIGGDPSKIINFAKIKLGEAVKQNDGVLFATYGALGQNLIFSNGETVAKQDKQARLDQIINWLGKDFDGVIAFDEAHLMQNSVAQKGTRGVKKPSIRALAGIELQKKLPNARVVYVSATGATEVSNLAYAERLGLWGTGTSFSDKQAFISKIHDGGLAAMELVARDMKAMGAYIARTLSFDGIKYSTLEHKLSTEQIEIYDSMAEGWQIVLQNMNKALEITSQHKDGNAKGRAASQFWSSQQRFFNQILTSMQMPKVIEEIKKDLVEGNAIVMQIVNTNEASQNRQIAKLNEEEGSLEDLDLTPRDMLIQYIDKCFPTQQFEEYTDENGNDRSRPVVDSHGNPVINQEAQAMKEDLMIKLGSMKVPNGPLEIILNTFGVKNVAEVTGRTRRVVKTKDEVTGRVKAVMENRTSGKVAADVDAFMNDKKQILVFSEAGGTGKSYHADLTKPNQKQRSHYLIQAGWRADSAVQGFGRTHRTNQASAPKYVLVTTDLKGQKRFVSSIARRLDQLGALTKGQRQTGSQGMFSSRDNLESTMARDALQSFYEDLVRKRIPGMDRDEILTKMGLKEKLIDKYGGLTQDFDTLRDITKFLNRLLSLESSVQNDVFDAFSERMERLIDLAERNGTLDVGLENFKADKVEVIDEKIIREDEASGAATKYIQLKSSNKIKKINFKDADGKYKKFIGFYKNTKSNNIKAVFEGGNKTLESGNVVDSYIMQGVTERDYNRIDKNQFEKTNWELISDPAESENLWNETLEKTPEYKSDTVHLISGALLPVWDRLPEGHVRVMRVLTEDGETLLGRLISENDIDYTLKRLNAERKKDKVDLPDVVKKIIESNSTVYLSNNWRLVKRKVSGEDRIEILGDDLFPNRIQLKNEGVLVELIASQSRYFIPTGDKAVSVLSNVTKYRPIVDITYPENSRSKVQGFSGNNAQLPRGDGSSTKAKSVDEIIDIIEKELDIKIATGKFRNRSEAIFKVHDEVIRSKMTNDLPKISHELGHYFDKKFDIMSNAGKQYDAELLPLGVKTSKKGFSKRRIREEGIAEFIRLYLTEPSTLNTKAPKFTTWFDNNIDKESLVFLGKLRGYIKEIVNLPNNERILNDVSMGEDRTSVHAGRGTNVLQKVYDAWINEYAPYSRIQKAAEEKGWTGENLDIKTQLFRGLEAQVILNLNHEQFDLDGNKVGKSYKDIMALISKKEVKKRNGNPRQEMRDYISYMISRRAIDYIDKGLEMPEPDYVYIENNAAMENKYPHFKDVFKEQRQWEDNNLQLLVESGIKTQAQVDKIKDQNKNHVPLYRVQEAIESITAGSGKSIGQSKRVIKKATGSGKTIIDPIESQIKDAFIMRRAAEANAILNILVDMSEKLEGFGGLVEKIPNKMRGVSFSAEEVADKLVELAAKDGIDLDLDGVDLDSLISIFKPLYTENQNEVLIYRNGKPELYEVDPELYKAVKGLNKVQANFIIQMLNVPKRVIQAGAVTTIQFILRNMGKDTLTSAINSESGINPIDIAKGYISAFRKDKHYIEFLRYGGGTDYVTAASRKHMQQIEDSLLGTNTLDRFTDLVLTIKEKTGGSDPDKVKIIKDKAVRFLYSPFNAIRRGTEFSEIGPRIAEFRKGVAKGRDPKKAAASGRDLSQDFARSGYYGKELNKITAFFNGNVQGIERMIRNFKNHPYRTTVRGLLYVTLPTMLLWLLFNKDNEDYHRLPSWRKYTCWNIPIGEGKFISLPRPYGYGFIFGAIPEMMANKAIDKEDKLGKNLFDTFALNFTIPIVPSILGPAVDLLSNRSWTGAPIESRSDQNLPPYMRANDSTSSNAKAIADKTKDLAILSNMSPKAIDYAVKGYTGTVGDAIWRLPDALKNIKAPTSITDLPVIKSFATDSTFSTDIINDFYDYGAELNSRKAEADKIDEYRYVSHLSKADQKIVLSGLKNARAEHNSITKEFSDARKVIDKINENKKMSDKQKQDRVKAIRSKMNDKADVFNKKYVKFKEHWGIK
jgi:hypothetical protein